MNTPHWTSSPPILQLATQPHQLIALGELRKLSLHIAEDKEKWEKLFKAIREKRK